MKLVFPFVNFIFSCNGCDFCQHVVISQVSFTLARGFPSGEVALAEAVPHMDGVELELGSAAEPPRLCRDTSVLFNELQKKLETHSCKIWVS